MKRFSLLITLLTVCLCVQAQNNIGIGTQTPHNSALLDVSSTAKGLLAPRMTTAQRNAIASPAKGLLVYDTDLNGLYHFNGAAWAAVGGGGGGFALPYDATVNMNTAAFKITNSGNGAAIQAVTTNEFGYALQANNTTNFGYSVYAYSRSPNAIGVYAFTDSSTGVRAASTNGIGVHATSTDSIAIRAAIAKGANADPVVLATHAGVGNAIEASSNTGSGIKATTNSTLGTQAAVYGINTSATTGFGVLGVANGTGAVGVYGSSGAGTAVRAQGGSLYGVNATATSGTALYGNSTTGYGLEVNGKIKIAGGNTNPSIGAVLTSDAEGNATWKSNRVAFSFEGANSNYQDIPNNAWRRVHFAPNGYDASNSFNLLVGTNLQPNSSTFAVPASGIYHFDASVELSVFLVNDAPVATFGALVLKRNRGGTITDLTYESDAFIFNDCCISRVKVEFSKDVFLQAGDLVYLEVKQVNEDAKSLYLDTGAGTGTYFNGHLIFAQ